MINILSRWHLKLLIASIIAVGLLLGIALPEATCSADNIKKVQPKTKKDKSAKPTKTDSTKRKSGKNKKNKTVSQANDPSKLPWPENVKAMAGSGAVLVADFHNESNQPRELFSLNADKTYIPASILKVVTAGAALESLGANYHFATDFYLSRNNDLWIVGHGDPFLVSEELCFIVEILKQKGLTNVNDIYLDTSYFESGLVLDGTSFSLNPYDAYNGAIGVNFNTVNFLIDRSGKIIEFDNCTPLTPMILTMAANSQTRPPKKGVKEVRLNISESPGAAEEFAGQMFKALLERGGVVVKGQIVLGKALPSGLKKIYTYVSTRDLEDMVRELLKHSNNYVTNQIFLTMGAEIYGAPATAEKGRQVVLDYLANHDLPALNIVEGSGLSRLNTVTARQMAEFLGVFEPERHLINAKDDGLVLYKTGTMSDIQTLAGYLVRPDRQNEPLSFVILLNGHYKAGTRDKILEALKAHFLIDNKGGG